MHREGCCELLTVPEIQINSVFTTLQLLSHGTLQYDALTVRRFDMFVHVRFGDVDSVRRACMCTKLSALVVE
jgi:hypothetical protein